MIESATKYWLECDECGEFTDWEADTIETAVIIAETFGWLITDDRHLCPECREVGEDA